MKPLLRNMQTRARVVKMSWRIRGASLRLKGSSELASWFRTKALTAICPNWQQWELINVRAD